MPFRNYSLTKNGQLTIGQILSPNFVHNVSGWEIRKDGTAEFHSIIVPPGTSGNVIFTQGTAPTALNTGDLWIDTASANAVFIWSGSAWTAYQWGTSAIASGSITASLIAANTITAAQLAAGIVYAGIVNSTTITGGTLIISQGSGATFEEFEIDGSTGITTWSKYQSPTVVIRQILANGTDLIYNDPGNGGSQGALLISQSVGTGTALDGTSYGQGLFFWQPGTGAIGISAVGGQPVLDLSAPNRTHASADAEIYAQAVNAGAVNELVMLLATSGEESGNDDAAIQLFSESADATVAAQAVVEFGGQAVAVFSRANLLSAIQPGTAATRETWHTMTLNNGWTVASGGFAQYRLMPDNTVMVRLANVTPGTISDGTSVWTAPSGYQASQVMSLPVGVNYTSAPSYGSLPRLVTRTTGDLQVYSLRGTVSNINIVTAYPLN
jgi:hypothetical protein